MFMTLFEVLNIFQTLEDYQNGLYFIDFRDTGRFPRIFKLYYTNILGNIIENDLRNFYTAHFYTFKMNNKWRYSPDISHYILLSFSKHFCVCYEGNKFV